MAKMNKNKIVSPPKLPTSLFSRQGLKVTESIPTIKDLMREGDELIAKEQSLMPLEKSSPPINDKPSNNPLSPYLRARVIVMNKYPIWRQKEIVTMEKEKNLDNNHYEEFVKEVVRVGDDLCP